MPAFAAPSKPVAPVPQPHAQAEKTRFPTPLDGLGYDIVDAFDGVELAYYGAAVGVTGYMAFGGTDHAFRVQAQRLFDYGEYSDLTKYAGYVLPVVIAPTLYVSGLLADSPEVTGAGSAVIQALAITVTTTFVLKLATGRPFPLHGGDPYAADRLEHPEYAHEFRPFQWDVAWPSGHTSASVAIAATLTGYYPDDPMVPILSYPAALAVGMGMIAGDHHWTSDVIAGGLIGQAIGYSVGRNFRRRLGNRSASTPRAARERALVLTPLIGTRYGVSVLGEW